MHVRNGHTGPTALLGPLKRSVNPCLMACNGQTPLVRFVMNLFLIFFVQFVVCLYDKPTRLDRVS